MSWKKLDAAFCYFLVLFIIIILLFFLRIREAFFIICPLLPNVPIGTILFFLGEKSIYNWNWCIILIHQTSCARHNLWFIQGNTIFRTTHTSECEYKKCNTAKKWALFIRVWKLEWKWFVTLENLLYIQLEFSVDVFSIINIFEISIIIVAYSEVTSPRSYICARSTFCSFRRTVCMTSIAFDFRRSMCSLLSKSSLLEIQ